MSDIVPEQVHETPTFELFREFLDVVNEMMHTKFAMQQVWTEEEERLPHRINAAVLDEDGGRPEAWFVVGYDEDGFGVVRAGKDDDAEEWRVVREHLEDVVANPEPYIEEPEKLKLDWIGERLSLGWRADQNEDL